MSLEIFKIPIPDLFPSFMHDTRSPPWAPIPGIRIGKLGASLLTLISSSGAVAPTTSPTLSLTFNESAHFATCSYSLTSS